MTIGWEHPEDTRRGWEGINSADMEWFRDEPIEKFAREAVQNSLDARNDMSKPVNVKFDAKDNKGNAMVPASLATFFPNGQTTYFLKIFGQIRLLVPLISSKRKLYHPKGNGKISQDS